MAAILLDYTGRLFRDGKAVISAELTGIQPFGCPWSVVRGPLYRIN